MPESWSWVAAMLQREESSTMLKVCLHIAHLKFENFNHYSIAEFYIEKNLEPGSNFSSLLLCIYKIFHES
jgi:hypothetical protein